MEFIDYQNFPEYCFGDWQLDGIEYPFHHPVDLLKCWSCREIYLKKRDHTKLFLYSVHGITTSEMCYDWSRSLCSNTESCWGPSRRYWTVLKGYGSGQWVFKSSVMNDPFSNHRTLSDELRVNLSQGSGASRLVYSGNCSGRSCLQFYPWSIGSSSTPRIVAVQMKSRMIRRPNQYWFEKLEFMYPNVLQMRVFEPPMSISEMRNWPQSVRNPKTEEELELNWMEVR